MKSSRAARLLSDLGAELDDVRTHLRLKDLEMPTLDPDKSEWWNFQHLVKKSVQVFYSKISGHHIPSAAEAWAIGERVLEHDYRPAHAGGVNGAFLDFKGDEVQLKNFIFGVLVHGLASEYARVRETSIINAWVTSLSWNEKLCIAGLLEGERLSLEHASMLHAIPQHKVALQIGTLVVLWNKLRCVTHENVFELIDI